MATDFTWTQRFDAAPDTVFAMLSDADYVTAKGRATGALEVEAHVDAGEDGGAQIVSRRVMPANLPSFVRRFVGDQLELTETQRWSPPDADGARSATFDIDFGSQPLAFSGTLRLAPDGDESSVHTQGRISASVPLVGRKVEGVAQHWTERFLAKEEQFAATWLDGSAGAAAGT
ncbi:MAG: DUF2505 domain-containing protein [Candidatus Nanopelagicales bacterium]